MKKHLYICVAVVTGIIALVKILSVFSPKAIDFYDIEEFTSHYLDTEGNESIKTVPKTDFVHFSQLPTPVKETITKSTGNRYTQTYVYVVTFPSHEGLQYVYRPGYPKEPEKDFTGNEDTANEWVFIKNNTSMSLSSVELDGKLYKENKLISL